MIIELRQGNILECKEDGILLTIDGAARGMEGNIARKFARRNADAWEEIEDEICYPISLGRCQAIKIHPEYDLGIRYCFVASTLNHLHNLTDEGKVEVQSSALRHALSLAEKNQVLSLATAVMVGGWRLEFSVALRCMIETIRRAAEISSLVPKVVIYVLTSSEYEEAHAIISQNP